ncbi:MAG: zf-HC2 domain-containing protein [Gemmatimonadetes bacterium]|nr:zf-HC2 domain-containing protein [Gemmatimonadota bacterium]
MLECERIRDELPALLSARLTESAERDVRAHLGSCEACAVELEVLRTLGAPVRMPAALESRVLQELNRPGRRAGTFGLQRLAMAATVVFALITAGVLMTRNGNEAAELPDLPEDWLGQEAPRILTGAPGLEALSEDELMRLLEELDS